MKGPGKLKALALVMGILSAPPALAAAPSAEQLAQARASGLAYLVKLQNADGSWGRDSSDKVRATSSALLALKQYGVSGGVLARGVDWLANAEAGSTDSLARQVRALAELGARDSRLEARLLSRSRPRFGAPSHRFWGFLGHDAGSALDSSLALEAMAAMGYANMHQDVTPLTSYLLNSCSTAGIATTAGNGWAYGLLITDSYGPAEVIPTAEAVHAFLGYNLTHNFVTNAADWLATKQLASGAFSDKTQPGELETALAVRALSTYGVPAVTAKIDNGRGYLVSVQRGADGSWGGDAFKTAESLRALNKGALLLPDADQDGLPDAVETKLGSNPNLADAEQFEKGNGLNFRDVRLPAKVKEVLKGSAFTVQLDQRAGTLALVSGALPTGVNLDATAHTLTGTLNALGAYAFGYAIQQADGSKAYGSLVLNVVDANSDSDGDGIPAFYELERSSIFDSTNAADATLDEDNDGVNNKQEYLLGTEPGDSNSTPVVIRSVAPASIRAASLYVYAPQFNQSGASLTLVSGPVGMSVVNGGIQWRPGKSQVGTHPVVLRGVKNGVPSVDQSFSIAVTAFVPGDVTGDDVVDTRDALATQRHVLGLAPLAADQLIRGDLAPQTEDGQVDAGDMVLIQRKALGLVP